MKKKRPAQPRYILWDKRLQSRLEQAVEAVVQVARDLARVAKDLNATRLLDPSRQVVSKPIDQVEGGEIHSPAAYATSPAIPSDTQVLSVFKYAGFVQSPRVLARAFDGGAEPALGDVVDTVLPGGDVVRGQVLAIEHGQVVLKRRVGRAVRVAAADCYLWCASDCCATSGVNLELLHATTICARSSCGREGGTP